MHEHEHRWLGLVLGICEGVSVVVASLRRRCAEIRSPAMTMGRRGGTVILAPVTDSTRLRGGSETSERTTLSVSDGRWERWWTSMSRGRAEVRLDRAIRTQSPLHRNPRFCLHLRLGRVQVRSRPRSPYPLHQHLGYLVLAPVHPH